MITQKNPEYQSESDSKIISNSIAELKQKYKRKIEYFCKKIKWLEEMEISIQNNYSAYIKKRGVSNNGNI